MGYSCVYNAHHPIEKKTFNSSTYMHHEGESLTMEAFYLNIDYAHVIPLCCFL